MISYKRITGLLLVMFMLTVSAQAQQFKTRYKKPQNTYFFIQSNLHAGIDSKEPGDQISGESFRGLSGRGPATQMTFELFNRREKRIQTGYTRLITPNAWNVKFKVQAMPISNDNVGDIGLSLRLDNTWVNFSTKWDRTQLRVGHQGIPFGHNPRIDGSMSFLPSQAGKDIGFGSDTGVRLRTGLTEMLDLEFTATAGGFLSGTLFSANLAEGQDFSVSNSIDYRGSWLGVARVGTPTFHKRELGVFVAVGKLHRAAGSLPFVGRIGADFVIKKSEMLRIVNQVNLGITDPMSQGSDAFMVYNLLNSAEMFVHPLLRIGVTNVLRYEDRVAGNGNHPLMGTLYGMISIPITRTSRFRINPYIEYQDATGEKDAGLMFQICTNCGLIK